MADTKAKRQMRGILSQRLNSYYETLMEAARRNATEKFVELFREPALGTPAGNRSTGGSSSSTTGGR